MKSTGLTEQVHHMTRSVTDSADLYWREKVKRCHLYLLKIRSLCIVVKTFTRKPVAHNVAFKEHSNVFLVLILGLENRCQANLFTDNNKKITCKS